MMQSYDSERTTTKTIKYGVTEYNAFDVPYHLMYLKMHIRHQIPNALQPVAGFLLPSVLVMLLPLHILPTCLPSLSWNV